MQSSQSPWQSLGAPEPHLQAWGWWESLWRLGVSKEAELSRGVLKIYQPLTSN